MPPVLFLSFLLPQRETALFFGLLLLPREHFLLLFGCIPLELQSLLRFCADPAGAVCLRSIRRSRLGLTASGRMATATDELNLS